MIISNKYESLQVQCTKSMAVLLSLSNSQEPRETDSLRGWNSQSLSALLLPSANQVKRRSQSPWFSNPQLIKGQEGFSFSPVALLLSLHMLLFQATNIMSASCFFLFEWFISLSHGASHSMINWLLLNAKFMCITNTVSLILCLMLNW